MARKRIETAEEGVIALVTDKSGQAQLILEQEGSPIALCPVEDPGDKLRLPSWSDDRRVVAWIRIRGDTTAVEIHLRQDDDSWKSRSFAEGVDTPVEDVLATPDGRYVVWSSSSFNDPDCLYIFDVAHPETEPRLVILDMDAVRALVWLADDTVGFIADSEQWEEAGGTEKMTRKKKLKLAKKSEVHAFRVSTGEPTPWPPIPEITPGKEGSPVPPEDESQWITGLDQRVLINHALSRIPIVPPLKKRWTFKLPAHGDDCSLIAGAGRVLIAARDRSVTCLDLADGDVLWRKSDISISHEEPQIVRVAERTLVKSFLDDSNNYNYIEIGADGTTVETHVLGHFVYGGDSLARVVGKGFVSTSDLELLHPRLDGYSFKAITGGVVVVHKRANRVTQGIEGQDCASGDLLWEAEVGQVQNNYFGVWKDKLFYIHATYDENHNSHQELVCREARTGEIAWTQPVKGNCVWAVTDTHDKIFYMYHDNKKVFAFSCREMSSGDEIPEQSVFRSGPELRKELLGDDLGAWGAEAVALSPGVVWIQYSSLFGSPPDRFLLALEIPTGKALWKRKMKSEEWVYGFADSCLLIGTARSLTCFGPKPSRKKR